MGFKNFALSQGKVVTQVRFFFSLIFFSDRVTFLTRTTHAELPFHQKSTIPVTEANICCPFCRHLIGKINYSCFQCGMIFN